MTTWKFFVRLGPDGRHHVGESRQSHLGDARQWQIAVSGRQKPTVPSGPLTEADYLRWRASLADNGYKVQDSLPFGSPTQG